ICATLLKKRRNSRLLSDSHELRTICFLTKTFKRHFLSGQEEKMNSPSDHLLYVLSARTELNWSAFRKIVDEILQDRISSADNVPALRNRVLRLLDAFGFCDVSF